MMRAVAYVVVAVGMLSSTPALALPAPSSTITNLQDAFEAELNATERFSSFARGAEQEGLPHAARLLRAIARAEEIHAQNHAEVLRALGAQPRAIVAAVEVRSTHENLRTAIDAETSDRDGRYPWWLGAAREIGDAAPLATLGVAMFVERAHVLLLEEALRGVESGRDAPPAAGELCVSRRSGYVTRCDQPSTLACRSQAHPSLEQVN